MHHTAAFDQIKVRAATIRLPLRALAREAGVAATTVQRIANGDTPAPRIKTLSRLTDALRAEETKLLRHLRELERSREGRQIDLVDMITSKGRT